MQLTLCHCNGAHGNAIPRDGTETVARAPRAAAKRSHSSAPYQKVLDARKRPIRGLWIRGTRYSARISVQDFNPGRKEVRRVPLKGAQTVAQAQAEMRRLLTRREDS